MRLLQLCKKFPYPEHDGEVIAINGMTRGLVRAGARVTVLAINTEKHHFDPEQLPQNMRQTADYGAVDVDTSLRPGAALLNLFRGGSYNIERFDSPAYRLRLEALLREGDYDVVQLEGLYLMPYLDSIRRLSPRSLVAFRAHNVEFEIWERLAKVCGNPLKKWYLSLLARRMKRYETKRLNDCDVLVPITEKDGAYFKTLGCRLPAMVCPVGIDVSSYPAGTEPEPYSVFHLGAMDWLPNQEGVRWLAERVWGLVRSRLPQAKLYLAGRNMPEEFRAWNIPGVEVLGEVADAREFMRDKALCAVPLLSGSGMRIKIVEAMAMGKAVVSTHLGAEGIAAPQGKALLRADTPEQFAEVLCACLENADFLQEIGKNARIFAAENFDYGSIAGRLLGFYAEQASAAMNARTAR